MTTTTPTYKSGDPVRFTAGSLGLLEDVNSRWFEPEKTVRGELGEYVGPHPTLDDWHVVKVTLHDGRELVCPCWPSHIEPA